MINDDDDDNDNDNDNDDGESGLALVQEGSEDEQVCEIHVKSMYIVVEKKVSALLQEFLREVR